MKPPPNGSESSGPDAPASWALRVLHGRGLLFARGRPLGEATCLDLRGHTLYLCPLWPPDPAKPLPPDAGFQIADSAGILRLGGRLSGPVEVGINRVPQAVLVLEVEPGRVERLNRRAHFRVAQTLKGEIAVFSAEELATAEGEPAGAAPPGLGRGSPLDGLARHLTERRRPCLIRDLSNGGARVTLGQPCPRQGLEALLDVALNPGETLTNLHCEVLEGRPTRGPPAFDREVRLRFVELQPRQEARLARYLVQLQRELIQKGVKA